MTLEVVEATDPRLAVGLKPGVELGEGLGHEAVPAPLGIDPRFDEADLPHDPEMLRHRRLTQSELIGKLAHEAVALEEQGQDLAAARFGDDVQERLHGAEYTTQSI
jgi:hypothetical protein